MYYIIISSIGNNKQVCCDHHADALEVAHTIEKCLNKIKMKRKDNQRLQRAEVHAAISVARGCNC